MSAKEMYDYIGTATATSASTLSVTPTNVLTEWGSFNQKVFWADDGSFKVLSYSPATPQFFVEFEFQNMSESDAGTVTDFYFASDKGNGSASSFYWDHPTDGHTYVLRFMPVPFSRSLSDQVYARLSIQKLTCMVEGKVTD